MKIEMINPETSQDKSKRVSLANRTINIMAEEIIAIYDKKTPGIRMRLGEEMILSLLTIAGTCASALFDAETEEDTDQFQLIGRLVDCVNEWATEQYNRMPQQPS